MCNQERKDMTDNQNLDKSLNNDSGTKSQMKKDEKSITVDWENSDWFITWEKLANAKPN